MPIEYDRRHCPQCGYVRRADRNAPDHLLHGALTFLTGGAWIGVWIVAYWKRNPWRCSVCGWQFGGVRRRGHSPMWLNVLVVVIVATLVMVIIAMMIGSAYGSH